MKNFLKLFGIIALVAVLLFSMASCDLLFNNDTKKDKDDENDGGSSGGGINPTITIKNSTGYKCYSFYNGGLWAKPSIEARNWGTNHGDGFSDGESRQITLPQPLSVCSVYDIRMNGDGHNFVKYSVTISKGMNITFTTDDYNDLSTLPNINIQNRSGKSFDSVYIKPSGASVSWESVTSFGDVGNNNDISIQIQIPPTNYTVFDIQTKSTNPTNTYTKNNVNITNGMIIMFTSADAERTTLEKPVIVIENKTGYSFYSDTGGLWIRTPASDTDWGSNYVSGWDGIDDGNSKAFSLPEYLNTRNTYDIKMSAGGFNFIKTNVTVEEGKVYTFTTSDKVD